MIANKTIDSEVYLDMKLLRFTTAGSVDDGKSTLIGRLLYDSKTIFDDQIKNIKRISEQKGEKGVNLALLTDGLRAEREQGITIDVAYRYFATPKRKFIIADTPGHIQYTRNMVTGASTANLALILIDARNGVIEQTIRHSYIASLLQIPHIVVCVNKMDLIGFNQDRYNEIKQQFNSLAPKLGIKQITFIPISAKLGDNVVDRSKSSKWYNGPTLIQLLETIDIADDFNRMNPRFPVQYVVRPQDDNFHDFRGYAGRIAGGVFKEGDKVKILPSLKETTIKSISIFEKKLEEAFSPQSVTLTINDNIDISRGNMIVGCDDAPTIGKEIKLMICWMDEIPIVEKGKYIIKHTSNEARCIIQNIEYKMNINTLEKNTEEKNLSLNDIGCISIKTTQPIFYDSYKSNRITGSIIFIDEKTYKTVGAGMIL